jgi:TatA/E family protein of Tat protein translocase
MFNLGPFELVAIFVVALLVFGPDKLPEMGRQVGRAVKEFKKFQASMQTQVRDVMEPITGPMTSSNGPLVNPQPTNIKGTLPSEAPPNVPRSATIQDASGPEGEEAPPPGTFGHYAPVEQPGNGGAPSSSSGDAPGSGESAAPASGDPTSPPAGSSDPDAG